jgi:hypothetical protein
MRISHARRGRFGPLPWPSFRPAGGLRENTMVAPHRVSTGERLPNSGDVRSRRGADSSPEVVDHLLTSTTSTSTLRRSSTTSPMRLLSHLPSAGPRATSGFHGSGRGPQASRKHGLRPGFPRMRCVRPHASLAQNGEGAPLRPRGITGVAPLPARGTNARQANGRSCTFARASLQSSARKRAILAGHGALSAVKRTAGSPRAGGRVPARRPARATPGMKTAAGSRLYERYDRS